jgi:murein DD-endopeptidase MepM/ murein hydrolase activator NlpD
VVAAAAGTVTFAGWSEYGLGYAVAIDHGHGLVTWYGQLGATPAVRFGQQVTAGQYLGPIGSSGNATAPHLHFMVMQDGAYLDPLTKLP